MQFNRACRPKDQDGGSKCQYTINAGFFGQPIVEVLDEGIMFHRAAREGNEGRRTAWLPQKSKSGERRVLFRRLS